MSTSSLSRFTLLAVACLATLSGRVAAAADSKEPYRLQIVLHVARHRLLTDVFREQLKRDLKDGLQAAMGKLARISVVDTHPKLAAVLSQGLQKGLDGWRERSSYKTHFVLIDFSGTRYEIQARQHNGATGLPSPTVRRERTRDRAYVARAAGLLIKQDLGLLGTVLGEPDAGQKISVALQGADLGVNLGRWITPGEVFSLVLVEGTGVGLEVPWALATVETAPKDGVCTCRLFSRKFLPRVAGLRCVLLGTRTGGLRLRLVEEAPGGGALDKPPNVRLEVRRRSFDGEDGTVLRLNPSPGKRDVETDPREEKGRFDRVAFITVKTGNTTRARFPLPIVDDRAVVLNIPPGREEDGQLHDRYTFLRRKVRSSVQVQADLFEEINRLTAKAEERVKALARVRETLQRSRDDYTRLSKERSELGKEIESANLPPGEKAKLSLDGVDEDLKQLRSGQADLLGHIALLEKIEKEDNDPKKKEVLFQIEKAKRLVEKEAELGQAIAIYKKVLESPFAPATLKGHLADLEKRWEPRNDEHRKARDFIYNEWAGLDTPGLADGIGKAEKAFAACKAVKDKDYPFKLLRGTEKHLQRMEKEAELLKPLVNGEDQKPSQLILELAPKLRKLDKDLRDYLKK
jgi:hypothetical protein